MKIKLLIYFFLISFISVSAQSIFKKEVELKWSKEVYDNIHDNTLTQRLSFQEAVFDGEHPEVAIYSFQIPIPSYGNVDVNISPSNTSPAVFNLTNSREFITEGELINTEIINVSGRYYCNIRIAPFINSKSGIEKLEKFSIEVFFNSSATLSQSRTNNTYNSVLENGDIYKVAIEKTGVYKIDGAFLTSNFSASDLPSSSIQVFSASGGRVPGLVSEFRYDDLAELPIKMIDGGDGQLNSGDYFLFFAEGADKWEYNKTNNAYHFNKNVYDVQNYVFIKVNGSQGKRISTVPFQLETEYTSSSFEFLQRYEDDRTNLLGTYVATEGTGKDWYGDYFNTEDEKFYESKFDLSDIENGSEAQIDVRLANRSRSTTKINLNVDGQVVERNGSQTSLSNIEADYARPVNISGNFAIDESTNISLRYDKTNNTDEAWLDFIQVIYRKRFSNKYDQLLISDRELMAFDDAGFDIGTDGLEVWDITRLDEVKIMKTEDGKFNFSIDGTLPFFMLVKPNAYLTPIPVDKVENQNIHSIERADLIIVYHEEFKDASERLANHRRSFSGFAVETVDINDIYNEFSSGRVDPTAIRDFAEMVYSRDSEFKYLLLIGDGSYDYRGLNPEIENHNFIPVYETDESLDPINGFPTDDYFGLLSPEEGENLVGGLEVSVGRLPVTNATHADDIVEKIIHYDTHQGTYGDWRLRLAFAADDEDSNRHIDDTDEIAEEIENEYPVYNQTKIYFDSYTQESTPGGDRYPGASQAINERIQKGALMLNYLGHGGPKGWAQERVLKISDIDTWNNFDNLPILITATCSFTGYDDPSVVSAGEYAIRKKRGGVLGLFTTVRAVYSSENERLTKAVFDHIFEKKNGKAQTLGDIIKQAKNQNVGTNILNDRKFALIGDPSQSLALPQHNIETLTVNEVDVQESLDTIAALEKVTITGRITDYLGQHATSFNGTLYPTVYDKVSTLKTLVNDNSSREKEFNVYRNILFKGAATVTNGNFEFSFVVPADINYSYGYGRISMYAHDGNSQDAAGVFDELVIGGSSTTVIADDEGPVAELFMNDENFVFGGTTDANPIFLAKLSDDLGINVSGTSIGHDIEAVLDGDDSNSFILNDFYEANVNDFTSGVVRFPLYDLEPGKHTIELKAWDVSNNSTESLLEFVVVDGNDTKLKHVLNYPNPFTTNTNFQFEHTLVGSDLDIFIDIYTVSGKLVKTIYDRQYASGYRVGGISWAALDDFGSRLARGVYFYKIRVNAINLNMSMESDFEKLVKM